MAMVVECGSMGCDAPAVKKFEFTDPEEERPYCEECAFSVSNACSDDEIVEVVDL